MIIDVPVSWWKTEAGAKGDEEVVVTEIFGLGADADDRSWGGNMKGKEKMNETRTERGE